MFTIRAEQFASLNACAIDKFYLRAARFFREQYAEEIISLDDESLLARIREAAKKASQYKIETELGIVYYAALDLLLGPRFDTIPEIADVLNCEYGTGDERMEALFERIDSTHSEEV